MAAGGFTNFGWVPGPPGKDADLDDILAGPGITITHVPPSRIQISSTGGLPAPPNMAVQWNDNGQFGGSGNLIWNNPDARLGINQPNPAYALDVGGEGRVQSNLYVDASEYPTVYWRSNSGTILAQSYLNNLGFSGASGYGLSGPGNTPWVSITPLGLRIQNISSPNPPYETLDVAGNAMLRGNCALVTERNISSGDYLESVEWYGWTPFFTVPTSTGNRISTQVTEVTTVDPRIIRGDMVFFVDSEERMRIQANGINGDVVIRGNLIDPLLGAIGTGNLMLRVPNVQFGFGVSTSSPWAVWMQAGNGLSLAGPLVLNPLGGNVGVNTLNPQRALDVNGDIESSQYISATNLNRDGIYMFMHAEGGLISTYSPTGQAIPMWLSILEANANLYLVSNGVIVLGSIPTQIMDPLNIAPVRVGVGMANPQYALDVVGDINLTGVVRINGVQVLP